MTVISATSWVPAADEPFMIILPVPMTAPVTVKVELGAAGIVVVCAGVTLAIDPELGVKVPPVGERLPNHPLAIRVAVIVVD